MCTRRNLIIQSIVYFLLFSLNNYSCKTDKTERSHIEWLQSNAINIKSIDPDNENYSDLEPLKTLIGDSVRIILLGEQTHGDGSTFLAKSRLIKFLHKEMGFNVLAFESGMYECTKAWHLIKEGNDTYKMMSASVYNLWSSVDQCRSLIKYIENSKHSKNPLELTGFDCSRTGTLYSQYMLSDLDRLELKCLSEEEHNDLLEWVNLTADKVQLKDDSVYYRIFEKLFTSVQSKENQLKRAGEYVLTNLYFWEHIIENLKVEFDRRRIDIINLNMDDPRVNTRDIQMGKNLIWMSKYLFPDRKIIVWAACFHNMRNAKNIIEKNSGKYPYQSATTMGDVLWNEFGNKLFNIVFTAYEGEYRNIVTGENTKSVQSSNGSLEYLLNKARFEYGFVNFRNLNETGNWLDKRMIMKPVGFREMDGNWAEVMDGVFFIKEMKPSTY